jgi:cyclopropane-fatty-acyl-phospholipid synthase
MYTRILADTFRKAGTQNLADTLRWASEQSPNVFASLVARHFRTMRHGLLIVDDRSRGRVYRFGSGQGIQARIIVHNAAFFRKLVLATDIGLGEAYVDGDWDTDDIGQVVRWFIVNLRDMPSMSGNQTSVRNVLVNALAAVNRLHHSLNENSEEGSRRNISHHYDLGNAFFASFLDETMTYSSALFASAELESLAVAQKRKLRNMADMAAVRAHHEVLEVGTGWGEFACFLAEFYGCRITTLTISEQQFAYARQKIRQRNLEDRVTVKLQDYRQFQGRFDRIFTVEMLEAVGDPEPRQSL